jgi:hypothetical protein
MESGQIEAIEVMIEKTDKLIHVGNYVAEVSVELIYDDNAWSPSLSHKDALKLDRVRDALESGDLKSASKDAKVFELKAVA